MESPRIPEQDPEQGKEQQDELRTVPQQRQVAICAAEELSGTCVSHSGHFGEKLEGLRLFQI